MITLKLLEHRRFLDFLRPRSSSLLRKLFLELCHEYSIQNLLEIGAHEASISCDFLALESSKNKRALAFEANPVTYKQITEQARDYGVEVHNFGISSSVGELEFMIPIWGENGNLTPGNASFLTRTDDETRYRKFNVATETIDHVFISRSILGTSALWIDVEGFAHEVIKGASHTLHSNQVVLLHVEVETINFWRNQKTYETIFADLAAYGYCPLARDFEYQYQYNVLFGRLDMINTSKKHLKNYQRQMRILIFANIILLPFLIIKKIFAKFFKLFAR